MNSNQPRYVSADEAMALINSGDHIYFQGSASVPETLLAALARRGNELQDITIYCGFSVTHGEAPVCQPQFKDTFLIDSFFVSKNVRRWIAQGYGVTTPRFLSDVPGFFRTGIWPLDVAFINCSEPDEDGYVSYGVGADVAVSAVERARIVIAQINPHMPYSFGDPVIHVSKLAAAVRVDDPLVDVPTPEPTEKDILIGNYIAERIPDGATLQIGVGGIPNAVLRALADHRDLGLHTEAMTDGVLPLIERGVINNSKKKILPGKSVASLALGSRRLYDYLDHNPDVIFRDVAWTNDPFIISQNPRVMSINSCMQVDLTGQVCSDSIGTHIYSGVGGQVDFVYGSSRSEGGHSFIAMLSTTSKGENKIKPFLTTGDGVVTTRYGSEFIVTEYGVANMRGASLPQRARQLINIAAPQFREELERAAFERYGHSFLRIK